MDLGLVKKVDIDQEMQQSYLDYAMSVIVARALPDARDGLKPVQRRILYAMYDMGLRADSAYKKSARIVGEVLGKYHPHGDSAVYEAMARMAQDFTIRAPLVDGQGNFGSVDGDPPAAMRYTEARLTSYAVNLLQQIDQDTIDFLPNFDGTLVEPDVIPAASPNLLVNGSSGIAVGMATNIPPHNLSEVIDALSFLLKEWDHIEEINVEDIMKFIKGPDFPTGGIILQENHQDELLSAYATGRGRIIVRGRLHVEEMGRSRSRLIITELPYLVNKSNLIERIAELVREGSIEGISDLRDESDRQGMRIVIELKQAADIDGVLRALYQRTPLQSTFGIIMLALVDGEPRLLTLKQALRVFLEHRLHVVKRRSQYELDRARKRAHILEGLRIALKNLDEVIQLIRNAPDVNTARERMLKRFKLSDEQCTAILDMPLKRLASLERKKIEEEFKALVKTIKSLEELLASPKKMRALVEAELLTVQQAFGDARRTQVVKLKEGDSAKSLLTSTAVTPVKEVWVGVSPEGVVARMSAETSPRLSGRDAPWKVVKTNTHQTLYLVAQNGKAAAILVEMVPEAAKFSEGAHFSKISPLGKEDRLAEVFAMPKKEEIEGEWYALTTSAMGLVKKTALNELPGPSAQVFTLAKVNTGDYLCGVAVTGGDAEILLVTSDGMAIRFNEADVRPMGLVAAGVNGIKLKAGEMVIGAETPAVTDNMLLFASDGRAWSIPVSEFPAQGRYGQGVIVCKLPGDVCFVGVVSGKKTQLGIVHFKLAAAKQVKIGEIPPVKRTRPGFAWVELKNNDKVAGLTRIQDSLAFWSAKPSHKSADKRKSRAPKK
ncbi:MAG: DNA topoisomerase 4 subunit A [Anaerolineaceae bacterium]|nr:DNA topoisomerase 4 subunit A [Anaerolineaceae bacterium]